MKTLKVEAFASDEDYYRWLDAREAGLRVSKYTPSIVVDDYSMMARIIVKCKRLDTAIKHAKEAFADYPAIVEALTELERMRAKDEYITGNSNRYNTINTCYSSIDGEYSFLMVHRKASEQESESVGETQTDTDSESGSKKLAERYTSNSYRSYAIITERKDGKFFVAMDCGESGDKCGESKVFDTYEEACGYLRSVGYCMLKKAIDVDESFGEGAEEATEERAKEATETTREILVWLSSELTHVSLSYSTGTMRRYGLERIRHDRCAKIALEGLLRRVCDTVGAAPKTRRVTEGGIEHDAYSVTFPKDFSASPKAVLDAIAQHLSLASSGYERLRDRGDAERSVKLGICRNVLYYALTAACQIASERGIKADMVRHDTQMGGLAVPEYSVHYTAERR